MIALEIEVPIACFRQSRAREYIETYPVPPPSTVYGMLLSLVGETDRHRHCGTRLAIALLEQPEQSIVLRTVHRFKKKNIADPSNIRPDYQEVLTNIQFIVWIDAGSDKARPTLAERVGSAMANPASINRFGGLSLGESRDLVNSVDLVSEEQHKPLYWLLRDQTGSLTLPYWVNHLGLQGTCWNRYELEWAELNYPPDTSWTAI